MEEQKGSSLALNGDTNTIDDEQQQNAQSAPVAENKDRSPAILDLDASRIQIEKYRELALLRNVVTRFRISSDWKPRMLPRRYIGPFSGTEITSEQRNDVLASIGPRIRALGEELGLWGDEGSKDSMKEIGDKEASSVWQDIKSRKVIDKQLQESALLQDELLQISRQVSAINTKLTDQVKEPDRRDLKRKVAIDDVEEGIAKLQERVKRFKDI